MNNELQAETAADSSTTDAILPSALLAQNPVLADAVFKPMLFSTPMVQAILDGRKTMTRRTVKAGFDLSKMYFQGLRNHTNNKISLQAYFSNGILNSPWIGTKCPFQIGNIIWVRETWQYSYNPNEYVYKADCDNPLYIGQKWKPSLFMPKDACRLLLQITDIKVERIQNISEDDSIAEGVEIIKPYPFVHRYRDYSGHFNYLSTAIESVKTLWHKINGQKSWDENVFVWVYSFKVVDCPNGFR